MTRMGGDSAGVSAAAAEVIALLDDMLRLYERAAAMGGEAGASDDGGAALETLRRRGAIVEQLRARDARLVGLRERLGASRPGPEDRGAVERKLAAVAAAARRLASADEQLRARLARRRDELADELAATGRGRAANAAYGRHGAGTDARMQDTEG